MTIQPRSSAWPADRVVEARAVIADVAHHSDLLIRLIVITAAPERQGLQAGPLKLDPVAMTGIMARHYLRDELSPGIDIFEVPAATQQQGLVETGFQMAMAALDGPVLMGDAAIVARGFRPEIAAERLVTAAKIVFGLSIEIGKRGRQAVGPMLIGAPSLLEGLLFVMRDFCFFRAGDRGS